MPDFRDVRDSGPVAAAVGRAAVGSITTPYPLNPHRRRMLRVALEVILDEIRQADRDYPQRYPMIFLALSVASQLGYPAGIEAAPDDPVYLVAYIELPTGQVSWHQPVYRGRPWDGHTTDEKYRRVERYLLRSDMI